MVSCRDAPLIGRARPGGSLAATVLVLGLLSAIGPSCALGLPMIERVDAPGLAGVYVVRPSGDDERVHLRLIVLSGEADNRGTEGIAHYAEHLAWLNAHGTVDLEFARHSNATTKLRSTSYWMNGRTPEFRELAQVLLRVLDPFELDEQFMLEERDIILREHDYRVVEESYAPLRDDLMRRLHGDGPFARSVLGRPEDIASFSLAEARAFHRETHRPANSVLIVRGDVSGEELRRILRDKFGPGRPAAETRPPEYAMGPPVRDIRTREAPGLARPELLYRKVVELPGTGPQSASGLPELRQRLVLLRDVLLSSLPGSLARPLRFDGFIAESFGLDIGLVAPRYLELEFDAWPDQGVSLDTLLREFEKAMSATAARGIPIETFERVRQRWLDKLEGRRDRQEFAFREVVWASERRTGEPPRELSAYREDGSRITLAQLDALMRGLAGSGRVVATKALPVEATGPGSGDSPKTAERSRTRQIVTTNGENRK